MLPLATVEQFTARLGVSPSGADLERAIALLDDASALVRAEAGLEWVDDHGELDEVPAIVEAITLAAAQRAYRNPDGAQRAQVGDTSITYGQTTGGAVYLTADERRALRRVAGASSIGTITLISPYTPGVNAYYVPVEGGGDPIPIGPFPWEII